MAPILPPDHTPIPSAVEDLKGVIKDTAPNVARAGVLSIALYQPATQVIQPYPVVQAIEQPPHADDPPSEDRSVPVSYSLPTGAQSTSDAPMPFNKFNWPVPQRRSTQAHLIMSSINAALLFGEPSSS